MQSKIATNLELIVTGLTEILQGLATVLSLGFVRPNFCMTWLVWNSVRKQKKFNRRLSND